MPNALKIKYKISVYLKKTKYRKNKKSQVKSKQIYTSDHKLYKQEIRHSNKQIKSWVRKTNAKEESLSLRNLIYNKTYTN